MIGFSMGRANLPAKKYKKSNPTVLRLSFEFSHNPSNPKQFIDIGMALSAINRKFYRQGVYYYVNSVEVYDDAQNVYDFLTLPDTWVTKNAWNRGFQLFQKMNAMVDPPISNMGRPKYHDFKVYMNDTHRQQGSAAPSLHGDSTSSQVFSPDEWKYSEFVTADDDGDSTQSADNFYVHMQGAHVGSSDNWTSVGLIKSYAESRITVEEDSPNDDTIHQSLDPLMHVFDFSSEEQMNDIIQGLKDDNDAPPYNTDFYVGEAARSLTQVARIGTETGLGRVGRASGFCVPFGLLQISTDQSLGDSGNNYRVVLNLAPGTYHGVYAERA